MCAVSMLSPLPARHDRGGSVHSDESAFSGRCLTCTNVTMFTVGRRCFLLKLRNRHHGFAVKQKLMMACGSVSDDKQKGKCWDK